MKKILMLILVFAMLFSLAACGSKQTELQPTEAPTVVETPSAPPTEVTGDAIDNVSSLTPAANLDPTSVNMGIPDMEDVWYKNAVKGDNYLSFGKADNSVIGLSCSKVEGGNVVKTWLCTNSDNHLIDQDAEEGKSEIDIVFYDEFKAYDSVSGIWYVRGNASVIAQLFVGKQFAEKDNTSNTLILNADGTGKEVFEGKEDNLTWTVDSASTLKYLDSEFEHTLNIVTDAQGNLVSLDEQNFRSFIPAA